jgi:exosortase
LGTKHLKIMGPFHQLESGLQKGARFLPGWLPPGCLLLVVWTLAIRQLSLEWTVNPEYQYGWIVPVLSLLIWWRAWICRPAPGERLASGFLPGLVVAVSIGAVPLRIIEEANPDWRLLNDYFTGQAIVLTALMIDYSGGRTWLRHFAFPLLFPLIAVPWPSGPEREIIQGLQRCIASISVEGASWLGWSAVQQGNLIILSHGIVGVNEACSGIRSLQSSLMIALFLGEYFRLVAARRLILVALALLSAFVFNAARAFFLMVMMDWRGAEALLRFHDPAGMGIAVASLLFLWVVASFMAGRGESPALVQPRSPGYLRFPTGWLVVLLAAWLAAETLNQAWYWWHERQAQPAPLWTLRWPPPRPGFQDEAIDEVARSYLRYDQGWHGKWRDQDQWELFFFTWSPSRASTGLAQSHRPDICLPAAGFIMKEDLGLKKMEINGLVLPIHSYVFQTPLDGQILYVFQAVTDDRVWPDSGYGFATGSLQLDRLRAAWAGRRNPGQRSLLIVNQGADNSGEAEDRARDQLRDLLVIEPTPAK